jgi:hypothetical protein
MPVMQIRPMGVIVFHRFVPVRVGMISILIHRRHLRAVDVVVMMEVTMGVPVRVVQRIMGVAVCVLLRNQQPDSCCDKDTCDDKSWLRKFAEYQ